MYARTPIEMEQMGSLIETRPGGQVLLAILDHLQEGEGVLGGQGEVTMLYSMVSANGAEVRIGDQTFELQVSEKRDR